MMHYLDNSATTRVCPESRAAAMRCMEEDFGNPSSVHSLGIRAEELVAAAREQVAKALGCAREELTFTSCGTEADNWALFGACELMARRGKHVITTAVEHAAVLQAAKRLERRGFEVTYLSPLADGGFDFSAFEAALREDTVLVSAMLVNNEVGAVTPVRRIRERLRARGSEALLHTDAVQGFLKLPFSAASLGADLLTVSGHKIHAPKGVGALYVRRGLKLPPFVVGGGQERGLRSGTESVPLIAAFGEACRVGGRDLEGDIRHMRELREYTLEGLRDFPQVRVHGSGEAPHILSLSLRGCPSEVTIRLLESREVYVSAGSACSRGHRSHVLEAMGLSPEDIDCALRVSFCPENTREDVDALLEGLRDAAARLAPRGRRR